MLSGPWLYAATATFAYLIGSIPFGLLIGRWAKGIDLREHGSLNIGATNAARVLGGKWGALVFLLDVLKGLLPTVVLPWLADSQTEQTRIAVACGVAAIVGHMFPVWLGFRGGKGVATSLGVVMVVAPWGSLVAVAVFAAMFATTRIVSASSLGAAIAFAIAQLVVLQPAPFDAQRWPLGLFSLLAPLLVIVRHRSNIGRLMRGEEPRFRSSRGDAAAASGSTHLPGELPPAGSDRPG